MELKRKYTDLMVKYFTHSYVSLCNPRITKSVALSLLHS